MEHMGFWVDDFHSTHWNVSKKALKELTVLANENEFEVVVVIFSFFQELERYPLGSLHAFIAAEITELGVFTIDLLEPVKEWYENYGALTLSPDSIHLTSMGASLVAAHIHKRLEQDALI